MIISAIFFTNFFSPLNFNFWEFSVYWSVGFEMEHHIYTNGGIDQERRTTAGNSSS